MRCFFGSQDMRTLSQAQEQCVLLSNGVFSFRKYPPGGVTKDRKMLYNEAADF